MKNSNIKKIVIIGATGGSAIVDDIIKDINKINNEFDILGYLDDNESLWGEIVYGTIVLGGTDLIETFDDDVYFISGIGSQENFKNKPNIINKWGKETNKFATVIHPSAILSSSSKIGKGVIIYPNVTIGPDVIIGNFVQILPNTVISHHSIIDNYSIINGSCLLAGWVHVHENCYLGGSTSIIQKVNIGEKTLIGMGSLVLNDIPKNSKAYGRPANVKN